MEAGTIVRWLKSEGDQVEKGEPLYELDTEKVTQEVEAEASGVLLKILAGEGEEIEVGKAIAVIGEQGGDVPEGEAGDPAEVSEEDAKGEGSPDPAREEEPERGRGGAAKVAVPGVGAAEADSDHDRNPLVHRALPGADHGRHRHEGEIDDDRTARRDAAAEIHHTRGREHWSVAAL